MREEVVKMKATYQCPAGGCDHPPLRAPSHYEAISETYTPIFGEEKGTARKVPPLLNRLGVRVPT
jgi:hypothetical protein